MAEKEQRKAIVVNDDPIQLSMLAGMLNRAGIETSAFEGPEAALAAMNPDTPPDLIVTDLYMPGLDGWRFCRLLRSPEYAAFNEVPILVVSATFAGDEPESIAVDIGADAFLPAPVDGKEFITMARALLLGREVRRRPRVLIVEDGKALAGMLKKAFDAHGYRADTAFTFREAQAAFSRTDYDLAVLDYHLPDGTGEALLEDFLKQRPECVCLMMTTDPTPELALSWMKKGASAYLRKPFEAEFLIELCVRARRERALLRAEDLLEKRSRELQESEEKYRAFFNKSIEGIFIHDMAGRILEVNNVACTRSGYSRQELLGLSVLDLLPAKSSINMSRDEIIQTWSGWEPGFRFTVEAEHQRKDGTIYPVEISTGKVNLGDSNVIFAVTKDISERKKAEKTRSMQEAQYQGIFEASNDTLLIFDFNGVIKEVNPAACSMYGYSYEEMIGLSGKDIVHPDYQFLFKEFIVKATKGELFVAESVDIRKDGTPFDIEIRGSVIQYRGCSHLLGVVRDISERKLAEEQNRRQAGLITSMLDSIPDIVFYKDLEGVYLGCNAEFARHVGRKKEEIPGVTDFDLYSEQEAVEFRKNDQKMLESGGPRHNEEWIDYPDGRKVLLDTLKTKYLDSQGNLQGIIGISRDITERKQAEEERAKLQAQLAQAQKLESVGRLAGGVAHDFNNMLGVILGHTEMALEQVNPDQPLHADLQEVLKAGKRSADLTRQLLAFARKQTIAPKSIELNETVAGMLKMLRRLIGEDIELLWKPCRTSLPVKMDPSQIDQILANLCVNARDAISGPGRVTIETGSVLFTGEHGLEQESEFVPGEYVLLAVSDNGCGMDRQTLANIFDPFFTTKEVGQGTGLGLPSVFGAVKQNKGFIKVSSEPGRGTTFNIYLPLHLNGAPDQAKKAKPQLVRGHETILLVEDEPAILRMTLNMLESFGYTVLGASSPIEALHLAREYSSSINLLMTDVIMPGMNGRELARNLLTIHPEMKCLFMSGYTADVISRHGVLEKGDNFIQKPFSMKGLSEKIREVLQAVQ